MVCGVENSVPHAVEVIQQDRLTKKTRALVMALHSSNVNRPEEERP